MVYLAGTDVEQEDNTEDPDLFQPRTFPFEYTTENNSQFEEPLLNFKKQLLSEEITSIPFPTDAAVTTSIKGIPFLKIFI